MKTNKELNLLRVLAEFRLATVSLLAAWLEVSEQMIRRRCRQLADRGWVKALPRNPGRGRGRPEWIYSLTSAGVGSLTTAKLLPANLPADQVTGETLERIAEHQIVLNQLAVITATIEELGEQFAVRFISSTSPFHLSNARGTILHDKIDFPDASTFPFTPDAAVCVTHRGLNKSLLFFLEVDMGTEIIADPRHTSNADVRRKIVVYRNYLGRLGYKRYEGQNIFNVKFNGFRVLLVAATLKRCEVLCRLVRSMAPSEFVWVTDLTSIEKQGISGQLWFVGGQEGVKRSILG